MDKSWINIENPTSIWFHAWNPNVKRFRRPVRMTGKVFPHLSINHVTKIFRYYGSSEHRVNQVRETFSIGCQKTWILKQKWFRKDDKKSEKFISYLSFVYVFWIAQSFRSFFRKTTERRTWWRMKMTKGTRLYSRSKRLFTTPIATAA